MTLLVLALALVGYGWWWLATAPGRTEARAEDDVARAAASTRTQLSAAAAGGTLFETELDRVFRKGPDGGWAEERDGGHITVTALLTGSTGVWMGTVTAHGCYEFTVTPAAAPPPVREREVPDERCDGLPSRPVRAPADVARDLAAELRATASKGTAGDFARWTILTSTPGVRLQDRVYEGSGAGQVTVALVWLDGGSGPQGQDCYEFRVRAPRTATFKSLKPDGCHRIQRERDAQAEAARRDQLDEVSGRDPAGARGRGEGGRQADGRRDAAGVRAPAGGRGHAATGPGEPDTHGPLGGRVPDHPDRPRERVAQHALVRGLLCVPGRPARPLGDGPHDGQGLSRTRELTVRAGRSRSRTHARRG